MWFKDKFAMADAKPVATAETAAPPHPDRASTAEIMDWNVLMETYGKGNSTAPPAPTVISADDYIKFGTLYDRFAATRQLDDYDYVHGLRFRSTAVVFGAYLEKAQRVVELGGHGRVGVFTEETFGAHYESYAQELRDRYDLKDASFDTVLCLEVIEHLKDTLASETNWDRISSFNYSGVMNVFTEAFRILQPGGMLLLTTPNATSADVIVKTLRGEHPHLFDPHVREMAPRQIKAFGERVGFVLEGMGTFFAWGTADDALRAKVLTFIEDMGFDPGNRGDDAYFMFRKPSA